MTGNRWIVDRGPTALELLDARVDGAPDDVFLVVDGVPLTAATAQLSSNQFAHFLTGTLGFEAGDRLAVLAENRSEVVVALFGALRVGGVVVPINSAYKGEFLLHVLADSGARALVVQASLADRLSDIDFDQLAVQAVVVVGATEAETAELARRLPKPVVVHAWADATSGDADHIDREALADDLAICLYTGGTTGPSKGCMLSHNALVHHAEIVQHSYGRTAADILWTPLPLFHLNAIKFGVIGALLCGGKTVISGKFSVSRFWSELGEHGATIANLLGSMATLIARSPNDPISDRLRLVVAVPMPESTRQQLVERFHVETFSGMYGMTECSTITLLHNSDEHRADSAGRVNSDDYDVRIVDDTGDEVEPGVAGEIVVRPRRGNIMFSGYWTRAEATVEATRDLWFRTGDIGRVDGDAYLWFVDRKGDYLRRRGENISSFEVERVLIRHPAIIDVAVHAVPSELTEDDVKVTAVRRDPELTEAEFFRWMAPQLPYFALPTVIEFRDELPRSPVGRVLKRQLRAEGITDTCWRTDSIMQEVVRR